jgi:actin related protein 2/3 complex subunit 3
MIRAIEKETTEEGAKKKLGEVSREEVATGNDKRNFMGSFLKAGSVTETTKMQIYLKGLKEILAVQLITMLLDFF